MNGQSTNNGRTMNGRCTYGAHTMRASHAQYGHIDVQWVNNTVCNVASCDGLATLRFDALVMRSGI